ncbi:MAG TPA: Asp-tRNA(Asn)/Glu-tRNA(Gln) amidotransferase subunit GatC [Candidatus Krumholzibacteria bacterium]|nr:Asp-tRNA(Asn)/Glu-tRNA(Gln) amidotransferase subunit GatC [Candidatus Krumholzibacteria bacterium]
MTRINRDVIRHLERLARIDLAPEEVEPITEQLNRIVALVERLQAVNVDGIAPTRSMAERTGAEGGDGTREDVVTPPLDRGEVLAQAPDATDMFFRVPRVIARGDES